MAAGNGIIGALLVSLGLDTAAFDSGVKETEAKVGKFGTALSSLGGAAVAGLAAGLAVAGAAFVKFANDSLKSADDIGDAAARIGVSAETFQKFGIAASKAGGTPELMTEAMDKLNENMGAFIQTGGGKAAKAFESLGIGAAITSGQIHGADQAFLAITRAMEGIEDPALKARIATQLFGKTAGPDMLEVLGVGADAFVKYGEDAQNAGRIMSDEMVERLAAAKLTIDDTTTAASQMATVLAGEAVVAIVDMAKELSPLWEQAKQLYTQIADFLRPSIEELGRAFINFASGPAGKLILAVMGGLAKLLGGAMLTGINLAIKAFTVLFNVMDAVGRFLAPLVNKIQEAFAFLKPVLDGVLKLIEPATKGFKAMSVSVAASAAHTVDAVGVSFAALPKVMTQVAERETKKTGKAFDVLKGKVDATMKGIAEIPREWSKGVIWDVTKPKPAELDDKQPVDRHLDTSLPELDINRVLEARAEAKQFFSETFSDGVMSAFNGNFGQFLSSWWDRMLMKQLDDLGGQLFDWFGRLSNSVSGISIGGLGDAFGSLFKSSPHFAQGGTIGFKGGGPVDSRLFSAWVSPDEIVRIGQAEEMGGNFVDARPYFDLRGAVMTDDLLRQMNQIGGQSAMAGARGGAGIALSTAAKRERGTMR